MSLNKNGQFLHRTDAEVERSYLENQVYSEDNLATQLYKVSLLLEEKIDSRKK
jgi:hypothetical protein